MTSTTETTEKRSRLLSDPEMDDIETKAQCATLDRLIEEYQGRKRLTQQERHDE